MVAMMDYKNVNPRDEWGGEKDARGVLLGFIRAICAIRGSLPKLDHGFHGVHGFPAAWPRWIGVKPSRTQSHSVALSQTTNGSSCRFSLTPALSPRRGRSISSDGQGTRFGDFCLGGVRSFPLLGERVRVRASLNSQRSGLRLRQRKTSFCKSLISMIVSDSLR
jgi:hypothetical protein